MVDYENPPHANRENKPKSISGPPHFLRTSSRALRDFIRDARRDEDRDNMKILINQLKRARRDENSKRSVGNKNVKVIKRKDIRIQNRKSIGNNFTQSKRKIIGSQGIINKVNKQ